MIRDKCRMTQERLFAVKRVFLGIHARGQLDARRQQRGLDAVWPLDVIEADAQRRLRHLPLKGLLRVLEYEAWEASENPPADLDHRGERRRIRSNGMDVPTSSDSGVRDLETEEQPSASPTCGARTRIRRALRPRSRARQTSM